jgi:hypothetical protein
MTEKQLDRIVLVLSATLSAAAIGLGLFARAVGILLVFATLAHAQAHPCDIPDQTVATKGNALGWCHDRKDADGAAITGDIGFRVNLNGTFTDLGMMAPVGMSPNAAGLWYFQAPLPSGVARGTYPVYVVAYSAEGVSPASTTISWQIGGPPNRPVKPRIARLGAWLLRPLAALR